MGARCFRSRDSGSCLTRLRAVEPFDWKRTGNPSPATHRGLVTTRVDEVKTISSVRQLVEAVGPLDTPHDAALVIALGNQGTFRCDGTKNARKTDTGWELRAWRTPCGKRVDVETFIRIASNGVVESVHEIEHPTPTENLCP